MVTIFDNPAIVETATMEHVEFPSLVDAVDYALLPFDLGGFNGRGAKLGDPQEVSVYSKNEITLSMDTLDGGKLVLGVNVTTGSPTTF